MGPAPQGHNAMPAEVSQGSQGRLFDSEWFVLTKVSLDVRSQIHTRKIFMNLHIMEQCDKDRVAFFDSEWCVLMRHHYIQID